MTKARILLAIAIASASTSPALAKKQEMSPLEIQQMQSRDIEATKDVAFASVMTVLQDSGYRIGNADKETGLITGTASTSSKLTWRPFVGFGRGKKTPVVSAYIESKGASLSRVRLNFVMGRYSSNSYGSDNDEEPILDPAVYQNAFEKIQQAVFIRQSTETPTTSPSAK